MTLPTAQPLLPDDVNRPAAPEPAADARLPGSDPDWERPSEPTAETAAASESPVSSPVAATPFRAILPRRGLTLFWRTFFMLGLMMLASTLGWMVTLRAVDLQPRAVQTAQQIASLVNLSRAALIYSDSIARYSLMKTLVEEEGVRILPREPEDTIGTLPHDALTQRVTLELQKRLGPNTVVASSVNGEKGLWIGFDIDGDAYWLLADRARINPVGGKTWLIWMIMAGGLSLAGAALLAGFINRPLKQLSNAIARVHRGDFSAGHLDESVPTKEIHNVNVGFNRMAEQMAKVEQERAIMLAGISHDLRTPLARLRLEAEMSVSDEEARKYMAADIEQLDGIISKFMDYAKPEAMQSSALELGQIVQTSAYPYLDTDDMRLHIDVPDSLRVQGDEIELARVVSNLMENARRYGKTPGQNCTELDVVARPAGAFVHLTVRDHGTGVPDPILARLTQPFYRADEARTSAAGSGLGLSIVKKVVEHMGGRFSLTNASGGGLQADLLLPKGRNSARTART